jgi:hypothetical protein
LEYLDDALCAKKFPSSYDREWRCPVLFDEAAGDLEGFVEADTPLSEVNVDISSLASIVDPLEANICLIVLRRVTGAEGKSSRVMSKSVLLPLSASPWSRYLCNSADSRDAPYETWSSSKIFAMANAAGKMREECPVTGLTSFTTGSILLSLSLSSSPGKNGKTALGDLSTVIASYDHTMGYSSNSLSAYFHDLGWRSRLNELVTGPWLNQPADSLGGNYVSAAPRGDSLTILLAVAVGRGAAL